MSSFSEKEILLFRKMNTPEKVQDFLNSLRFNFEEDGKDTLSSPLEVVRRGSAHCFEGALLGAYILSLHGHKPLILHLLATRDDFDHVISPFKWKSYWGALSKTNHAVLRYREPIYKNIRELAMSYFHEYFLNKSGKKTLRKYSYVLNLNTLPKDWITREEDLWFIDKKLDKIKHYNFLPSGYERKLRRADQIERRLGEIVEFKSKKKRF